jgi:hypothetical protein
MDSYQLKWAYCFVPMFIVISVIEIRRGWKVLRYGELSLSLNQRVYVELVRLLKGDEAANRAYQYSINNANDMTYYAWSGIIGGIFTLAACFFMVTIIIRSAN